ncbi:NTF2-like protein [Aspergillus violaceofuscus CBS 115571]|uniref:NTF2-like protein n=1 Tax=Aspergillus violaceofuscus (strain CBS 115571) TaxID=1450538 RepID=A0A2V5H746_ASPV1|nr:NTF2-like protein [Aspergillus violaceofuscus CBS 115571]
MTTITPPTLPSAPPITISPTITLQPPLSRCGEGPGLLLIRPANLVNCQANNTTLDPAPTQKWAEESYTVVEITLDAVSSGDAAGVADAISAAVRALSGYPQCSGSGAKFGVLVYGSPRDYAPSFPQLLQQSLTALATTAQIPVAAAAIYFSNWANPLTTLPALFHLPAGQTLPESTNPTRTHHYPDTPSPGFIVPGHADFTPSAAGVAHTRSLTFLKPRMGGPYFDLEQIWEEHTHHEFGDRSVEKTMATMVQEPYVNHIPTMTGGTGRPALTHFYERHFIHTNPADTSLELISRTVGVDRVVDEFILCMTHDTVVDWLVPGIPPTGRPLRVPFTAVVNIRGDRLYHEHIAWDQATVLRQLGLLPQFLPFPYAVPLPAGEGEGEGEGRRWEYRVPAAGVETARKLRGDPGVVSNGMMGFEVREVTDS